MKKVAMKKGVGKAFEVGEVVLVPLADVNKAKVDAQNLTGVIVKIDTNRMLARVVVKSGLLKQYYSYHIRSSNQDDTDGTSSIVLPCPSS